jgi:hypothetical protein
MTPDQVTCRIFVNAERGTKTCCTATEFDVNVTRFMALRNYWFPNAVPKVFTRAGCWLMTNDAQALRPSIQQLL